MVPKYFYTDFGYFVTTWSNYRDTIIVYACLAGGYKGFGVYTNTKTIPEDTKLSVWRHLKSLWFF